MPTQAERTSTRGSTLGGQKSNGPRLVTEGLISTASKEHVMTDLSISVHDAHKRNQLALSILSHRDPTPETVAAAIAALKGESLPSLTLRGA